MARRFKLLGTGAGPGTPSFFCECPGCREALENPVYGRTRSGAMITSEDSNILVDTPPDLRVQLLREKINQIDYIFLTHWHYDHFGGLGELEYYVKLKRKERLPLYLPASAKNAFDDAFPNLTDVFRVESWKFGKRYFIGNLSITPLPACHGIETAGFLVESGTKRLAYFPDTAALPAETARSVAAVDWLIVDATFYGENWFPEAHMSVDQAINLGLAVNARQTVFTHLSIHYSRPVINEELTAVAVQHPGVLVGYDGMVFEL
ncbi:MAG: phnP [Firmicutes bacterium]|nr:phnP [Bacillota bacterium]